MRDSFEFVAPTASLEEVLKKAIKSDKKPYFISDMGDNPTAGGAGDVTWTLQKLLARPEFKKDGGKTLVYSAIPGPEMVARPKRPVREDMYVVLSVLLWTTVTLLL